MERNCAVFIDSENIGVRGNLPEAVESCHEFGRVVLARSYYDWKRRPSAMEDLYRSRIQPIYTAHLSNNGYNKSIADVRLACDVVETLHRRPDVDVYVIFTGDGDFVPLIDDIRSHGKWTVVIGREGNTSSHLQERADIYLSYRGLVGESEVPEVEVLVRVVRGAQEQGRIPGIGYIKQLMVDELGEGFEEETWGSNGNFSGFEEFVREAEKLDRVQVVRRNGGKVVLPARGGNHGMS